MRYKHACIYPPTYMQLIGLFLLTTAAVLAQPDFQWDRTYGGTDYEELHSIRPLSNGDYILGGYTQSMAGGDVTYAPCDTIGQGDYWLLRTDIYGEIKWD